MRTEEAGEEACQAGGGSGGGERGRVLSAHSRSALRIVRALHVRKMGPLPMENGEEDCWGSLIGTLSLSALSQEYFMLFKSIMYLS